MATNSGQTSLNKGACSEVVVRILLVEDDERLSSVVARNLVDLDFAVDHCLTGEKGLGHARLARPDLILLDLGLPDMTGWQLLDALRSDPQLRHTPVIVVSGQRVSRRDLTSRGLAGYVAKPFLMEDLSRAIVRALGEQGSGLS